jgi:pimeloyl-ACP methyl ester carboxylesterase
VLTPGGQEGLANTENKSMARLIAAATNHSVLTWDRRNCGGPSSVSFSTTFDDRHDVSESEMHILDLRELLRVCGVHSPVHLFGKSSGARLSLMFAARWPELVRSLAARDLTGGAEAAVRIPRGYYTQYVDMALEGVGGQPAALRPGAAEGTTVGGEAGDGAGAAASGGMAAVLAQKRWQKVLTVPERDAGLDAEAVERVRRTPVPEFVAWARLSAGFLAQHAGSPTLGVAEGGLRAVACPVLLVHSFRSATADGMHTRQVMERVLAALPAGCAALVVSPERKVWSEALRAHLLAR